jgi:hypothetical protein
VPSFAETLAAQRLPEQPFEALDWSAIDPDHARRLYDEYAGRMDQALVDSFVKHYPAPGIAFGEAGPVDLSGLADLSDRVTVAEVAHRDAKAALAEAQAGVRRRYAELALAREARNDEVRALYRTGISAPALARALGLSVVRVTQIVAGARG